MRLSLWVNKPDWPGSQHLISSSVLPEVEMEDGALLKSSLKAALWDDEEEVDTDEDAGDDDVSHCIPAPRLIFAPSFAYLVDRIAQ